MAPRAPGGALPRAIPRYKTRFVFVQAGAPSRRRVAAYQALNGQLRPLAAAINHEQGVRGWRPIVLVPEHHGSLRVQALYRLGDLRLVSSLHDGMNLAAKEHAAPWPGPDRCLSLNSRHLPIYSSWVAHSVTVVGCPCGRGAVVVQEASMKSVFVVFVVAHLAIDLAMPSLPGAFRFNPDECAVGVRVQPAQPPDLQQDARADLFREPGRVSRLEGPTAAGPKSQSSAPGLVPLLPRRDLSSDLSPPEVSGDD